MGTETGLLLPGHALQCLPQVKLNNPLMGTETSFLRLNRQGSNLPSVKLNNPLMGTETIKNNY